MSQVVFGVSRIQIERSANSVNCMHKLLHLFAHDGRGHEIGDISLDFFLYLFQTGIIFYHRKVRV